MKILIAGCGWLGSALGVALLESGHRVIGIRRGAAGCRDLQRQGIEPLQLDLQDPTAEERLPGGLDAIVAAQSADERSEAAYRAAYVEATAPLLGLAAARSTPRFVYVSSTGVFGQQDGGEVDESTAPAPAGPTARILVEAERQVLDSGVPACVVRPSGLYGPGRYGSIERVRSGLLALGPGEDSWMNWCHQADAVKMLLALLERGEAGSVYHASDAEPIRRGDFVRWVAARLGIEPARRDDQSPGNRRGANRRISAEASHRRLGLEPVYPSVRDGLTHAPDLGGSPRQS